MDQVESPSSVLNRFCVAEESSIAAIEKEIEASMAHVSRLKNLVVAKRGSINECRRAMSHLDSIMKAESEEEVAQAAVECCDAQEVAVSGCVDEEIKRPKRMASDRDYLK